MKRGGFLILISLLMTLGMPVIHAQQVQAQQSDGKYALLIGIDQYQHMSPLNGTVRDVIAVKKLLIGKKFGFDPKNVLVITNAQATADNILQAFRNHLIDNARLYKEKTGKEAVIYFHYSGHGSQVKSSDPREPDGLDETIVTVNSRDKEGKNFDLIDDEIEVAIEGLARFTTQATYVFDSCNSGTINRGSAIPREVPMDKRPQPKRTYDPLAARGEEMGNTGLVKTSEKYVVITGSQSNEQSYERFSLQGGEHGYLTYHLLRELPRIGPRTTYRELMNLVAGAVTAESPRQHPQLLGNDRRLVLGGEVLDEDPYIQVKKIEGGKVIIAGGAAMGIVSGARVAFYSPETLKLIGPKGKIFENEVIRVSADEAAITIPDSVATGAITLASKAVITSPMSGAEPLVVVIDQLPIERGRPANAPSPINGLIERIKSSQLLKLTLNARPPDRGGKQETRSGEGDIFVRQGRFGEVFRMEKPLPQKDNYGPIPLPNDQDEVFYLAMSVSDEPLVDFWALVKDQRATELVTEALEKLAKQRNLRAIENRTSPFNQAIEIGFRKASKVRKDSNGKIVGIDEFTEVDPLQTKLEIPVGTNFKLRIKNRGNRDLHVAALNISSDGAINLMYPRQGSEALRSNGYVDTDTFITSRPYGLESFKIIVTEKPIDFSPLTQGKIPVSTIRGVRGENHPLQRLINQAGIGKRSDRQESFNDMADWGTVQFFMLVSRAEIP